MEYRPSCSCNFQLAYAIGRSPSGNFCIKTAPRAIPEASVCKEKDLLKSSVKDTGSLHKNILTSTKACCASLFYTTSFVPHPFVKSVRGWSTQRMKYKFKIIVCQSHKGLYMLPHPRDFLGPPPYSQGALSCLALPRTPGILFLPVLRHTYEDWQWVQPLSVHQI